MRLDQTHAAQLARALVHREQPDAALALRWQANAVVDDLICSPRLVLAHVWEGVEW